MNEVRMYRGQQYECVGVVDYTRKDGGASKLQVWESRCAECGEPFLFKLPATSTFSPSRRCFYDRKPGKPAKGVAKEPEAKPKANPSAALSTFKIGDRVGHTKFGVGTVRSVEGSSLVVIFDDNAVKVVLHSEVKPKQAAPAVVTSTPTPLAQITSAKPFEDLPTLEVGDRVLHPTGFGEGTVVAVRGSKLFVDFEDVDPAGGKRVLTVSVSRCSRPSRWR
jgi:hypothetical protein